MNVGGLVRREGHMRIAIVAILVVWAAVFAAVVTEAYPPGSITGPATAGHPTRQASTWMVLERAPDEWRQVRGPFAGAEACLRVSDALNNRNTEHVFDCDEVPNRSAGQGLPR
jgi:hypothetical protein